MSVSNYLLYYEMNIPGSPIKIIIDRILVPDCPPVYQCIQPLYTPWYGGYESNPCQIQKLQEILAMLNSLLIPLPRSMQLDLINQIVVTFVPGQGNTEITLLEAAIIQRWPKLVAQLLAMGASPNISTSGISLVAQLLEAIPLDTVEGNTINTQAIIELLLSNGSFVPPGFPGTHGYLPRAIRREYPYRI